jgi:hypothetical protein
VRIPQSVGPIRHRGFFYPLDRSDERIVLFVGSIRREDPNIH